MTFNTLISNLQNPKLYDHPIKYFKVIETHVSVVILTGDYAYKIKKSLNLGFLDFTTLEKRRFFCQEELRLNQRTAPDMYLAVLPITGSYEQPWINGDGPAIEYLVKMREFPQEVLFDELLKNQQLSPTLIDATASMLASFHANSDRETPTVDLGTAENVYEPVQQNFDQIRPLLKDHDDLQLLQQLETWAAQQQQTLYKKLQQRKTKGFIRNCHGDVYLKNIALIDDKPVLFDCIEFNIPFRWTDTMADLGFLTMDLEDLGYAHYAYRVINTYLEKNADYHGLYVLRYYQHYRAMVRAKIALFRLQQADLSTTERNSVLLEYRQKMQLAQHYSKPYPVFLAITYGVSGSGKTTLAQHIVEKTGAIRIRSDVERKRLAGIPITIRTNSAELNTGIYSPEFSAKTYQHLAELAQQIIAAGYPVIIDAAFLKHNQRQLFITLAQQLNVPFYIYPCELPAEILQQRIRDRLQKNTDSSDGTERVMMMQQEALEALSNDESRYIADAKTIF